MKRVLIALIALPLLAACGGGNPGPAPAHHATASAAAASASRAAAACSKLTAAAFPPAAYDQLVISEVSRIAAGGTATSAQRRAARERVAAEVRAACPQFAYLATQEQ